MPHPLLITTCAVALFTVTLRAQNENPTVTKTATQSIDRLNCNSEVNETESGKSVAFCRQRMLHPRALQAIGQYAIQPLSMQGIPTDTPRVNQKSWISVAPGSLPGPVTFQPDATQKYGANPGVLQISIGHRS